MKDFFIFKNVYNIDNINDINDLNLILDKRLKYYDIDLDELQKYTIFNFEKSLLNVIN